uniref:Uncharacterized protein n=1 Tax=Arundo donax TaxID=35708 RepID=A0A0A9FS82_ARUDO
MMSQFSLFTGLWALQPYSKKTFSLFFPGLLFLPKEITAQRTFQKTKITAQQMHLHFPDEFFFRSC